MKNLFPIILLLSLLSSSFATAMDQAERAGMKLVKPGLWINASNNTVYVSARTTEIKGGEPCEYILAGADGGHGYESLFVSKILPSEIQEAMEQAALPAGSPSDTTRHQFWPKGERVILKVHYAPPGGRPLQSHPPETFILQRDSNQTLPPQTWTFTGCLQKEELCLADQDMQSIIALYNESYTIFCPPGRAGKNEMYGSFLRNTKNLLPENLPVMLSISPEPRPTETRRVVNINLSFELENGKLSYRIGRDKHMKLAHQGHEPGGWIKWFKENLSEDQDWHVRVQFAPELPLKTTHLLSVAIKQIEGDNGIRVDAPPAGQRYYKTYTPDPKLRERKNRPHQPLELHLRRYADHYTSTLMKLEEKWSDQSKQFEITEERYTAPSPKALKYLLGKHHFPTDVAFIYCSEDTLLRDINTFMAPLLDEVKVVYVFPSSATKEDE